MGTLDGCYVLGPNELALRQGFACGKTLVRRTSGGYIFFLMVFSAFFSNRLTWAWEIPTSAETSIWVFPS